MTVQPLAQVALQLDTVMPPGHLRGRLLEAIASGPGLLPGFMPSREKTPAGRGPASDLADDPDQDD
jgi:hypothetical protein